jgi:hypothetical protein
MKKPKSKPQVSWDDFITAWEASESVEEVAKKTGLSETTVKVKGYKLRKMKVAIKQYPRKVAPKLTAADANEILARVRKAKKKVA